MRIETESWQGLPLQQGWKLADIKELRPGWRGEGEQAGRPTLTLTLTLTLTARQARLAGLGPG